MYASGRTTQFTSEDVSPPPSNPNPNPVVHRPALGSGSGLPGGALGLAVVNRRAVSRSNSRGQESWRNPSFFVVSGCLLVDMMVDMLLHAEVDRALEEIRWYLTPAAHRKRPSLT